jgi:hypothetical protein
MGFSRLPGPPPKRIDVAAIARYVAAVAPGLIVDRVDRGVGIKDTPLAQYAPSYFRARSRALEQSAPTTLRLTGGLLASVKSRKIEISPDGTVAMITIAPDAGTSPRVSLLIGRARRTGKRGPAHNVLGYWLQHGTAHMRARPWLGLSPSDWRDLRAGLAKVRMFR